MNDNFVEFLFYHSKLVFNFISITINERPLYFSNTKCEDVFVH